MVPTYMQRRDTRQNKRKNKADLKRARVGNALQPADPSAMSRSFTTSKCLSMTAIQILTEQ